MITLKYKGWDFDFEKMPTSAELEEQYRQLVGKTELTLPVPVPRVLERDTGPYRADELVGRRIAFRVRRESAFLATAARALLSRGAHLLVAPEVLEDPRIVELAAQLSGKVSSIGDGSETDKDLYGVLFDISTEQDLDALEELAFFVKQQLPRMVTSGRVVVLGRDPGDAASVTQAAVWRGVYGFVKTIARELGPSGSTINHISLRGDDVERVAGPLRFLLSPRSAYFSAQPLHIDSGGGAHPAPQQSSKVLEGKVALVTGAARGIGRSTAELMAQEGARVICVDLPADNRYGLPGSDGLLTQLADKVGGIALSADVAAADTPARMLEVAQDLGGVDILVNNAAIVDDNMLSAMREVAWRDVMAVNLEAPLRIAEAFQTANALNDWGRLIFVASVAGVAGNFGQSNYSASKAGLIGVVKHMAREGRSRGVTSNCVAPGTTRTTMLLSSRFLPEMLEAGRRLNALSQWGHPSDAANMMTFLSTPAAQGINGQWIRVCGSALQGA